MRAAVKEEFITVWSIRDGLARSPDLPVVAIKGVPFLGIVGIAPSEERMRATRQREAAVNEAGGWALMPSSEGAIPSESGAEGLRTMPRREIGGNLDIKDVAAGARLTLPSRCAWSAALLRRSPLQPGRRREPRYRDRDVRGFASAAACGARKFVKTIDWVILDVAKADSLQTMGRSNTGRAPRLPVGTGCELGFTSRPRWRARILAQEPAESLSALTGPDVTTGSERAIGDGVLR